MKPGPAIPRDLAHDLRNCLCASSSFAQLLRDGSGGPLTEVQREYLGYILDCTNRAQALLAPESRS